MTSGRPEVAHSRTCPKRTPPTRTSKGSSACSTPPRPCPTPPRYARAATSCYGWYPDLDIRAADAADLPLDDRQAHGYRADKVYHVLPDPGAALTEARRVLAPGGRIVLVGQDWDTMIVDSDLPDLTRRIVHARADTIPHPRIARGYRNLLLDNGFRDVEFEVHTTIFTQAAMQPLLAGHADAARQTGAITAEQAEAWVTDQARRAASGRMMMAIPMFLATATR
ncbi:methyltransferase domain-containing protein [Micromonospora sp. CPCC 205371]|nr:methyltransferase domain-containing protein [Micromonospora sp. CPCC 205371]